MEILAKFGFIVHSRTVAMKDARFVKRKRAGILCFIIYLDVGLCRPILLAVGFKGRSFAESGGPNINEAHLADYADTNFPNKTPIHPPRSPPSIACSAIWPPRKSSNTSPASFCHSHSRRRSRVRRPNPPSFLRRQRLRRLPRPAAPRQPLLSRPLLPPRAAARRRTALPVRPIRPSPKPS